jgi:rhodanese-related sulfurtransferase
MDTHLHSISVSQLTQHFGSAQQPLIVDVRAPDTFAAEATMIAGATWRNPFTINDWLKYLPRHRDIIVYCVHGYEISRNVCSAMRAAGLSATYLEGGIEAWKQAGAPTMQKLTACRVPSPINSPSIWVTRERPKIDRIACPWLIRRFIDPFAAFLYVPAGDVLDVAQKKNAMPYDVPNVQFSHRGEKGELCSFDAFVTDFQIDDPVLQQLAVIVRGADTGHPELTPQSPGLMAVSLGLSALYPNDHDMLGHGMVLYDALYAWLKNARNEIHNADLFKRIM